MTNRVPSNTKQWGNTTWISLHSVAARSTDIESFSAFIIFLTNMIKKLPCGDCKMHGSKYVETHPPRFGYSDPVYGKIGALLWTWDFHNSVNKRIGKPFFSKESLLAKYLPEFLAPKSNCTTCGIRSDRRNPGRCNIRINESFNNNSNRQKSKINEHSAGRQVQSNRVAFGKSRVRFA